MTVLRLGNGPRLILQALPLPGSEFELPDDCNQARSNRYLAPFIPVLPETAA